MESLTERKHENGKPLFVLKGFSQTTGVRLYAFESVGDGRRLHYTVAVDLALIPTYGIRIQDLPLLCRDLLQQRVEPNEVAAFTFTEQDMRGYAEKAATARDEAAQRKKPVRHPTNATPGTGWRSPFLNANRANTRSAV